MNEESIYKGLGRERKQLQEEGLIPKWYTTMGWQMFKEKYATSEHPTIFDTYWRIANAAAKHMPSESRLEWCQKFFDLMWKGWLAPSTPVMANMGADRGCPVSCSGSVVGDSVYDFYESQKEIAILSKNGFGTSSYLGGIRPRGASISSGGTASGVLPVFRDFVQLSRDISQGATRRGAWAGYIEIDHDDFWEILNHVTAHPDDANIGWIVSDRFIHLLNSGDKGASERYQKALKLKMVTGKGYFFFVDKVNRANPQCYVDNNLKVKASQLCTEITLFSDEDHTYTCVLSSMNLAKYDEWKETTAVFDATVFLDCVAEEFISIGMHERGLEKAVRYTKKARSLGLGTLGFHTYLQQHMIPFESFDAHQKNIEIFSYMNKESLEASQWMAEELGEPEWCKGYGIRNTHRLAVAPNLSSALLCGGVSQGIEPVYKNVYIQSTAAGEVDRINPVLMKIMRERGKFNTETLDSIVQNAGSVQDVEWLTEQEKDVFKTAFEIDQSAIIRLAASRQRYIDQAQSINLFFSADEDEEVISRVHQEAFENEYIRSLYYIRSESGVKASSGECIACEG